MKDVFCCFSDVVLNVGAEHQQACFGTHRLQASYSLIAWKIDEIKLDTRKESTASSSLSLLA